MIGRTAYSYRKAHEILWKHGHWKFLLAPIGLSVVLFFLLIVGTFALSNLISHWTENLIDKLYDFPDWVRFIWLTLFFALGLGTCYVAFRALVMVCYGPFLERLSVEGEKVVKGHSHEVPRSILAMIKRPLLMALLTVGMSLLVLIAGFLLTLIPVAGVVLSAVFVFPTQVYLSAVGFVDPYLDRAGLSANDSFRLMRKNFFGIAILGLVGLLITLIPVVGWFVGPTYSAAAGIVFAILITDSETGKRGK